MLQNLEIRHYGSVCDVSETDLYLDNQASDHPGSLIFFAHLFALCHTVVSVLHNFRPNLNHTNKIPINLYVADFKQHFPDNCTILMVHIMLLLTNCEVHTGKYLDRSFEVRTERIEK